MGRPSVRVLITNAYTARNKGDAAIILGMLRDFRSNSCFEEGDFGVSSSDPVFDACHYPCEVFPSLLYVARRLAPLPSAAPLIFIAVLLPISVAWVLLIRLTGKKLPLPPLFRSSLDPYYDADIVVAAGGGYLYSSSVLQGNVILMVVLFSFSLGVLLGKPVYLYAQSIGPFQSRIQAWMVKIALRRVRLIQVREPISQELMRSWKLEGRTVLCPDAAFLLPSSPVMGIVREKKEDETWIGVTARNWFRSSKAQEAYEEELARFLGHLVSEEAFYVFFLPQVTAPGMGDDDRLAAARIARRIGRSSRVMLVGDELEAPQIKWLCGQVDFFVGTRLHSCIFALSMGVPTIAIGYQPKALGIFRSLGIEGLVIPAERIECERLLGLFRELQSSRAQTRDLLRRRIESISSEAYDNSQLIYSDFRRWEAARRQAPFQS